MIIKNGDFVKIMEYVKDQLVKQCIIANFPNGYDIHCVPQAFIMGIPASITLEEFLAATGEKKERQKPQDADSVTGFDIWWKLYPLTSNFTYHGMRFFDERSKTLRVDRDKCQRKYLQIISSGEVTSEQLIKALEKQVRGEKEESYKTGENTLRYFGMSSTYLNQGKYMGAIGENEDVSDNTQEAGSGNNFNSNCA